MLNSIGIPKFPKTNIRWDVSKDFKELPSSNTNQNSFNFEYSKNET